MKVGIPLGWPQRVDAIASDVERVARLADEGGIDSLWTADHLFQIPVTRLPREAPMLECYATLAHVAAITSRTTVGVLVTCVMYRHPGMLLKAVTTLDVLSGGRVVLGLGVGWDAEEAAAHGLPFPALAERFERLEELLQLAHQTWTGDDAPFKGRHYELGRPLNSPNSVQRPHPPILVAGGGERRTLRLVAKYADACNLFDLAPPFNADLRRKLDTLRTHCDDVGRDIDTIEKTVLTTFDRNLDGFLAHLQELCELGIDHAIVMAPDFEWGDDLKLLVSVVDEIHGIRRRHLAVPA